MHFILLFLISSCSLFLKPPESISAKGSMYKMNFDTSGWDQKKDERSDYIFVNKEDGRILLSNSFCEEFQEQGLDILARKTFNTVKKFKITKESYTTFHDREAYRLEGKGEVDGVSVGLKILNSRRDNCYFDFVAITPVKVAKTSHEADFENFLKSVDFK